MAQHDSNAGKTQWDAFQVVDTGDVHVVPVDDIIGHDIDRGCPCGPLAELVRDDGGVVGTMYQHISLDQRGKGIVLDDEDERIVSRTA